MKTISVIIPVHNGGSKFRQCLMGVQAATSASDEVIVVADGDSDGAWRAAEEFGARVLRLPETGGPARARNIGAQAAHGELLVFVDADVVVYPNTVRSMLAVFEEHPSVAAVFGSYDDSPAETNFLSQYRNLLHHFVHQNSREEASTFWTGCGAIRRDVFLAMGGFDERRYKQPSIEDIELGYRLKRAGHQIRLCKTVLAKHLKQWGIVSILKTDVAQRAVPWTELILRDGRFIDDLNLSQSSRASVVLAYAGVICLAAAWWWPWLLAPACLFLLTMLAIVGRLVLFFRLKRGTAFALATIPWVCLFQLYSGLGFGVALLRHWTR